MKKALTYELLTALLLFISFKANAQSTIKPVRERYKEFLITAGAGTGSENIKPRLPFEQAYTASFRWGWVFRNIYFHLGPEVLYIKVPDITSETPARHYKPIQEMPSILLKASLGAGFHTTFKNVALKVGLDAEPCIIPNVHVVGNELKAFNIFFTPQANITFKLAPKLEIGPVVKMHWSPKGALAYTGGALIRF